MRARHHVVVDNGDWYNNNDHEDNNGNCYDKDNHDNDHWKGVGSELTMAAAEVAAVATAGADNNQQRAAKTAAAAIAVGKRRQARGVLSTSALPTLNRKFTRYIVVFE
jgi:hypothetical protein